MKTDSVAKAHNLHPAITRVYCPNCGEMMRLARIDPHADPSRAAETSTFSCECGSSYRHTLDRITQVRRRS